MEEKLSSEKFIEEFKIFIDKNNDLFSLKNIIHYDFYSYMLLHNLLKFKNLEKLNIKIPGFDNLIKFLNRINLSSLKNQNR